MSDRLYFRVRNFEKYQHYKFRNPPWIKLYHSIWSDPDFYALSDASKLLAIGVISLASQYENKLPIDHEWLQKKLMLSKVDFSQIYNSRFIDGIGENASKLLASCKRSACAVTETVTETEYTDSVPSSGSVTEKRPRRTDEIYDLFAKKHLELLGCPYQSETKDFVQLARLKKSLGVNGSIPEAWEETCAHFFSSPMGKYTLADLCSRYPAFHRGQLDRFGKPPQQNGIDWDKI